MGTNQAGAAVVLWSNDGSGATRGEPAAAVTLPVDNGLFAVLLGDAALPNMRAIPATVFTNSDVRLRVWFSEGGGVFEALAPDQRIAAVGYAMMAAAAVTVVDGTVSSSKLAAGAVTGDKLAPGAVSAEHLVNGQVVKSLNSLKDDVMLVAGANITLSTNGNALQIAAGGGGTNAVGWSLTGNSGVVGGFLGTLDNQPLEIKVGNSRVWRFEPTWTGTGPLRQSAAANSVGGYRGNQRQPLDQGWDCPGQRLRQQRRVVARVGLWREQRRSDRLQAHPGWQPIRRTNAARRRLSGNALARLYPMGAGNRRYPGHRWQRHSRFVRPPGRSRGGYGP